MVSGSPSNWSIQSILRGKSIFIHDKLADEEEPVQEEEREVEGEGGLEADETENAEEGQDVEHATEGREAEEEENDSVRTVQCPLPKPVRCNLTILRETGNATSTQKFHRDVLQQGPIFSTTLENEDLTVHLHSQSKRIDSKTACPAFQAKQLEGSPIPNQCAFSLYGNWQPEMILFDARPGNAGKIG
jgi:hypothetical protein